MALNIRNTQRTTLPIPSAEALQQCKEVATTSMAASYFLSQFEKRLIETGKMEEGNVALAHIREFAQTVTLQREIKHDPWSGKIGPLTDFHNLQRNLAEEAAEMVVAKIQGQIIMDYAINDNSQFIRGYSAAGRPMDEESVQNMDKLFNAWLAENNKISKGSTLYESDERGQILRNAQGENIKADSQEIKQMIVDESKGFSQFLRQFNKEDNQEINMTARQQAYLEKTPQALPPVTPSGEGTAKEPEVSSTPEATNDYSGPNT
jgi:hypothetical protein